jgi:hypothetical protein
MLWILPKVKTNPWAHAFFHWPNKVLYNENNSWSNFYVLHIAKYVRQVSNHRKKALVGAGYLILTEGHQEAQMNRGQKEKDMWTEAQTGLSEAQEKTLLVHAVRIGPHLWRTPVRNSDGWEMGCLYLLNP